MIRRLSGGFAIGLVMGLAIFAFLNPYSFPDWWTLRSYTPSAEIEALAKNSFFTSEAERLFYVHDPKLQSSEEFMSNCPVEETVVLGCYDGRGIYIFEVEEEQLDGIEEVTAAHEMLHAAYARLSNSDQQEVVEWLNITFDQVSDQRIRDVVATYESQGQDVIDNELHSILATELEELPEFLEDYYSQYFTDRSQVVALSQQYEAVFTALKDQVDNLDMQLSDLSASIRLLEASLETQGDTINTERERISTLLDNDDIPAYNQAIPGFNQSIDAYNQDFAQLEVLIAEFNDLVKQRNSIATEQNNLVESIDSNFSQQEGSGG